MSYETLLFTCIACGTPATGNPHRVMSVRVRMHQGRPRPHPDGTREPLCRACADRINQLRTEAGLEPFPIAPDAYEPHCTA